MQFALLFFFPFVSIEVIININLLVLLFSLSFLAN